MDVVWTAAGLLIIALVARDIFDALFHPEGRATLSRALMRAVWWAFHRGLARREPSRLPLAGPLILLSVITTWAVGMVVGWALVFLPHMPESFRHAGEPGAAFVDSLELSLVTLTTLGFSAAAPTEDWLRIVVPVEALVGFGLLTASISWLLLIYPVLSRRRSLAYDVSILLAAERDTGVGVHLLGPEAGERVYADLASRLVAVERDLVGFPVAYYFAESDPRFALPAVAPYLLAMAERGAAGGPTEGVRLRAGMLRAALDDLAATTAERFHRDAAAGTEEALRAYAADHRREPLLP